MFTTFICQQNNGHLVSCMRKFVVAVVMCLILCGYYFLFIMAAGPDSKSVESEANNARLERNIINMPGSKYSSHSPIVINSNSDFVIGQNGVTGGSGTKNDPYLIEGWYINASCSSHAISIGSTTAYFVVQGCSLQNASGASGNPYAGVLLHTVVNGMIKYNNISHCDFGIRLDSSHHTTVYGNNITYGTGCAVGVWLFGLNNTVCRNSIQHNDCGIHLGNTTGTNIPTTTFHTITTIRESTCTFRFPQR